MRIEPGQYRSDIRCSLQEGCPEDDTAYHALSYVWLKPEFVREIRVDDGYLLVTEGVFAAVKNLRPEDQPLTIWIDQVCINQDDFDERFQQVMLMRDIYTRSQQVYIWLGEYAELCEAAFGIMPKILDCVECTLGYLDSN